MLRSRKEAPNLLKGFVILLKSLFDKLSSPTILRGKGVSIKMLSQKLMDLTYQSMRIKIKVDERNNILDSKTLETIMTVSKKYPMDFLARFWELMQKYINEIHKCFDEKQFFEISMMRLCYVNLMPTPFELLEEKSEKKGESEHYKKNNIDTEESLISNEKQKISKEYTPNNLNDNLAIKHDIKSDKKIEKYSSDTKINSLLKFKSLVDKIEMQSEMLISHHLKKSFKLVRLVENKNVKEIELENISSEKDVKKILWKASKLINDITNERWMISLSVKKGIKTLIEYEKDIEREKIQEVKKIDFVKKILEIIPSSEIVSIKDFDNTEISKKKDEYE